MVAFGKVVPNSPRKMDRRGVCTVHLGQGAVHRREAEIGSRAAAKGRHAYSSLGPGSRLRKRPMGRALGVDARGRQGRERLDSRSRGGAIEVT